MNGNSTSNGVAPTHSNQDEAGNRSLHIIDGRTGKKYDLPISHNAVKASDFQQIKAPEDEGSYADQNGQGIRIFDPGFSNTAVSTSSITFM